MLSLPLLTERIILSCILISLDSIFFIGGYGILRLVHISADWVTWIIGFVLIVASLAIGYAWITVDLTSRDRLFSNLFGVLSFGIAVYAAGQWIVRHWYLFAKKWRGSFLARQSRAFLIFIRKQHIFFGWLVAVGAVAHMIVFLPQINQERGYEIVTGFIAIGILALSVLLGLWTWYIRSVRKQKISPWIFNLHSLLSIAFLLAVAIHL
jgi:hypothetical protein